MATSWESQQGDGKYSLQFETDCKEKYKVVEKAAQMAVDGKTAADVVPVVRCKDCKHAQFMSSCSRYMCHKVGGCMRAEDDYCNYGERKE